MNIANLLTISRLFLTVGFLLYIWQGGMTAKIAASVFFVFGALTDYLDGYFAKKYNLITDFGKIMDPIADKFLMLSAFYAFAVLGLMPWIFFVLIFVREFCITVIRLFAIRHGRVLAAEKLGKWKTVSQTVFICALLIFLIVDQVQTPGAWLILFKVRWLFCLYVFMVISVFLTVVSGLSFLRNNFLIKDNGNEKKTN